jgi:hypothetical protein
VCSACAPESNVIDHPVIVAVPAQPQGFRDFRVKGPPLKVMPVRQPDQRTRTHLAYALHRQLPYGVPGAHRLLANLLSLRAQ